MDQAGGEQQCSGDGEQQYCSGLNEDADPAVQRRLGRAHVRGIYELLTPALTEDELADLKSLPAKVLASLADSDS